MSHKRHVNIFLNNNLSSRSTAKVAKEKCSGWLRSDEIQLSSVTPFKKHRTEDDGPPTSPPSSLGSSAVYGSSEELYKAYYELYFELNDTVTSSQDFFVSTSDTDRWGVVKRYMWWATAQTQVDRAAQCHRFYGSRS